MAVTLKTIPSFVDEVVIADNGSTDQSPSIAKQVGATVVIEKRRGYGYAHKAGIAKASGNIIVTMDCDGTYPVEDVQAMLDYLIDKKLDFISGQRLPLMTPGAMKLTNIVGTKVLNFFTLLLFQRAFKDILSGMWVFKKESYQKLVLTSNDWNFSEEIKIEAARKLRFSEYRINHHIRLGETKLLKWRVGAENLIFLFWKRFRPATPLPPYLKLT